MLIEKSGTVLLVDDNQEILNALTEALGSEFNLLLASNSAEALDKLETCGEVDVAVLDIRMAEVDGLKTARLLTEFDSDLCIIFHTAYPGDYPEMKIREEYGPFDYIEKHSRVGRLREAIDRGITWRRAKRVERDELVTRARRDFGIVGVSDVMVELYRQIDHTGASDTRVILLGPPGSGKHLVARALHSVSKRQQHKFVPVDCTPNQEYPLIARLFGDVTHAYPSAAIEIEGVFGSANGGTVFLEELAHTDGATQARLVQLIEQGTYERIGSSEIQSSDIRLICASRKDLDTLVKSRQLREDLYYLLKGAVITVPPLETRPEDIPGLIDHFVGQFFGAGKQSSDGLVHKVVFDAEARDLLISHNWPGNVRQLKETIISLLAETPSDFISRHIVARKLGVEDPPDGLGRSVGQGWIDDLKRKRLVSLLDKHDQVVAAVARELEMDRSNLNRMIKRLRINLGPRRRSERQT